jgi:heavy metal translocating P-type ATPase
LVLGFIDIWHLVGIGSVSFLDFSYVAIILCGYPIIISAVKGLKKKKINSSLLVTVAIIACLILEGLRLGGVMSGTHMHGYVFAAGEIAFLMSLGGLLEAWTVNRSRRGIEKLISMSPKTANIRFGDEIKKVDIAEVKIGDIIVVMPHEMVPVDGVIIKGESAIDESSMTGEFVPVDKCEGDSVWGATWNKMGAIEIRVTKEPQNMTINKLTKLVSEAEGQKAPISRLADKWAGFIVPGAMLLSVVVFLISFFGFGETWIESLIRGATILVVFCPCALTLATPTAVAAGIGNGAFNGIIIKSGDAIERMSSVKTVAFDKTGTITTGCLMVQEVIPFGKLTADGVLQLAGSAEKYSEHPIGKAIYSYAKDKVALIEPNGTKSLLGVGVSAKIDGKLVKVVSFKNAAEEYKDKNLSVLTEYIDKGYSVVVIISGFAVAGAIVLSDTIKSGAKEVISSINTRYNTVMLTGDNINAATTVAAECGVKEIRAGLMPEDKLNAVLGIKNNNNKVCMVGDGVNDAPALAAADCSIAMGALGSDIAIETADVAVMNSDLKSVENMLKLSKTVMRKIKVNIAISMTISFAAIIMSTLGWLDPVWGAVVHNASSVLVVGNSALILRKSYGKKPPKRHKNAQKQKLHHIHTKGCCE